MDTVQNTNFSSALLSRGPPGDLYVYLDIEEIPEIQTDGINLRSAVSISYLDAILGFGIQVNFLCDHCYYCETKMFLLVNVNSLVFMPSIINMILTSKLDFNFTTEGKYCNFNSILKNISWSINFWLLKLHISPRIFPSFGGSFYLCNSSRLPYFVETHGQILFHVCIQCQSLTHWLKFLHLFKLPPGIGTLTQERTTETPQSGFTP